MAPAAQQKMVAAARQLATSGRPVRWPERGEMPGCFIVGPFANGFYGLGLGVFLEKGDAHCANVIRVRRSTQYEPRPDSHTNHWWEKNALNTQVKGTIHFFCYCDGKRTLSEKRQLGKERSVLCVCVFKIVYSALAELSDTSIDIVGVLEVLLVILIDLIIIVSVEAAVNKAVSLVVAKATPLNL